MPSFRDILIKVLSWFCLERDWGRPSTCITEMREWSNIASIRKTELIFKVSARAAFRNPWGPDLSCLSGLLMTLSLVGSHVPAPGRWHYWLDGHEFEWTLGVGGGQGGRACCDSWGRKESDTTERLNWTNLELLINEIIQDELLYVSLFALYKLIEV